MRAMATSNTYINPYLDHTVQAHLSKQIWTTELRAGTRTGTNGVGGGGGLGRRKI